jgi:dihydrofolate synthase/folylpolyglutamate synthase
VFQDEEGLLDLPPPRLLGRHQFTNAGTAIKTLRVAGVRVPNSAIGDGLQAAEWPARMQRLTQGRLVDRAAGRIAELWLDGGHNPGAGAVIAEAMADLEDRQPRPLHLIMGMLTTKNPKGFLTPFSGLARMVTCVPVGGHSSYAAAELAAIAKSVGLSAVPAAGIEVAIDRIATAAETSERPRVLICGSLYLAGTVLELNGTPPR